MPTRHAFTLVELLVVMFIILLVSVLALPTIVSAISHRQVSDAARLLQAALAGARDAAIHNNAPRGIRLLPDPTLNGINPSTGLLDSTRILASNRIVPIQPAPDYSDGLVNILQDTALSGYPFAAGMPPYPQQTMYAYPYPNGLTAGITTSTPISVLMVEQSPYSFSLIGGTLTPTANPPTSWFWNVRVGDMIRFNSSGRYYTVVGPMTIGPAGGNSELFVNDGLPGANLPLLQRTFSIGGTALPNQPVNVEYLFLVNGLDDNNDGLIDSGWDGLNNNYNAASTSPDELTDELVPTDPTVNSEWEAEAWDAELSNPPPLIATLGVSNVIPNPIFNGFLNLGYTITRRPIPSANQKETALPSNVVVDLTTWGNTNTGPERSRLPLNSLTGFVDILVSPQGDVIPSLPYASPASFGMANSFFHFWLAERGDLFDPDTTASYPPFLPLPVGSLITTNGRQLNGENRLVTLFTRSGQLSTSEIINFDVGNAGTASYNTNLPFLQAQQGVRGGP